MNARRVLIGTMMGALAPLGAQAQGNGGEFAPAISVGLTAVAQTASDSRIGDEILASADLVLTVPQGAGQWTVYAEGSTTPRPGRVNSLIGDANGDAGSALDGNGEGRLQISELHYSFPLGRGALTVGLVDLGGFLDGSDIASDETSQFLAAPLTGNPLVGSPDYTLGLVYQDSTESGFGYIVALGRSHGLGDVNGSYASLFDARYDADGDGTDDSDKGWFAALEGSWTGETVTLRAGLWTNTADLPLTGSGGAPGTEHGSGAYLSADFGVGPLRFNARLGTANDKASDADRFAALAAEWSSDLVTVGAGYALTQLGTPAQAAGADDATHAEIYARFDLGPNWHLSPTVQRIGNPGFDASGATVDKDVTIWSIRLGIGF